jgi:signal peptidase
MNISKIIYYTFVVFLLTVAILLIVSTIPVTGNIKIMTVLSGSMEPAIKTGSVVIVKPFNDYKMETL